MDYSIEIKLFLFEFIDESLLSESYTFRHYDCGLILVSLNECLKRRILTERKFDDIRARLVHSSALHKKWKYNKGPARTAYKLIETTALQNHSCTHFPPDPVAKLHFCDCYRRQTRLKNK
jgi:hypothetical protein